MTKKLEAVIKREDEVPGGIAPLEPKVVPVDEQGRFEVDDEVTAEIEPDGGIRYRASFFPEKGFLAGNRIRLPLGFEGTSLVSIKIRDRSEE